MKSKFTSIKKIALLFLMAGALLLSNQKSNAQCQAGFQFNINFLSNSVQFYDSSSATGSIASYFWTFGDNTTSTLANPSHIYSQPGIYFVCLTITTVNPQCTSTYCDTIYLLNAFCQAAFNYTSNGSTFQFNNTSTGGVNYYWNFGDNTTSSSYSPSHTYSNPGTYNVCLTITDSANNCSNTYCQTVIVPQTGNCQASFYSVPDSSNANLIHFINTSVGGGTYYWTFGDNSSSTQSNPSHLYASAGTYTVCLTIADSANNCSDTFCSTITIQSTTCNASFYAVPDSANPFTFHFVNTSVGGATYLWTFGDNASSTLMNPSHMYAQSGSYIVCLTIYNNFFGCSDSYCDTVYVNAGGCQAYFTSQPDSLQPTTIYFTNQSVGGQFYYWSFGDNTTSNLQNPLHSYSNVGYYLVCLTIVDSSQNCSSSYCDSVFSGINGNCNAAFTWLPDTNNTVYFTNTSTGGLTYYWTFGDNTTSTQANPAHTYTSSGTYTVCLTIYNSLLGCSDTDCQIITAQGACNPQFFYWQDTTFNVLDSTYFWLNNNCGAITVIWNFGDSTTYTGLGNPSHLYADSGWYNVCITIINQTDTIDICDSIYVLRPFVTGMVQNEIVQSMAFYPNPVADVATVTLNSKSDLENVSFDIYSTDGRLVKSVSNQFVGKGLHPVKLDVSGLGNGLYLLRAGNQQFSKSVQFSIVK